MPFSYRLKELRTSNKATQKQVADAIEMSEQDYSDLENGIVEPKMSDVVKLCNYFNASSDYLLGLSFFTVSWVTESL